MRFFVSCVFVLLASLGLTHAFLQSGSSGSSGSAPANYTYVYAAHVEDASGSLLANGTITFTPTTLSGTPVGFRPGGGGVVLTRPVQAQITSGAFNVNLADVSLASPTFFCYSASVVDNTTGATVLGGPSYACLQPTGSTFDFDNYVPTTVPTAGNYAVTGTLGVTGSLAVTGQLTAGSISGPIAMLRSGTSANSDLTGALPLSGGTASYTFTGTYARPPNCMVNDFSSMNPAWSSTSTTTLTIHGTGTDGVSWLCAVQQ